MIQEPYRQALKGSLIVGFGLLGAFDGIIFHQLLQWHSVVMVPDRRLQIASDGIFHALTTVALVWGAVILWRSRELELAEGKATRLLWGGILMGGGAFNLIEGIINHHLLQIHHVKQGDPHELMYDLLFLASGALLLWLGWRMARPVMDEAVAVSQK